MWAILFLPILSFVFAVFAAPVMEEVKKTREKRHPHTDVCTEDQATANPFPSSACS